MMSYRAVNNRIVRVRVKASPFNISFIQVYAPTHDAEDEEIEDFYRAIQETMEECPSQDIVMIVGDFNAKVGADSTNNEVCGRYGLGTANERGERLLDFCHDQGLYIANTAFKHHDRRRYTWQTPGGGYRNQIDYILVKKRWMTCITNARAYPGPDCGSDHNMVSANIKLKIKKDTKKNRKVALNVDALRDGEMRLKYNAEVNNRFAVLRLLEEERTPEELFVAIKETLKTVAEENIGRKPKKTNKPWISDETLSMMDNRRELKKNRATEDGESQYQAAHRAVQRAARADKDRWLKERIEEVEEGLQYNNNPRKAYKLIKALRKNFQPRQRNIQDKHGKVLTDLQDILARWKEYASELYSDKDNADETETLETAPEILEAEIEAAIKRLPNNKATGYDDLPAELLKTENQTLTKVWCKLCNKILQTGQWPTDWLRSVFVTIPKISGTSDCAEHRTIALISHASKILLRVLLQRIQKTAEEQLADEQMGFRRHVGTRDQIFNIRILMEKAREFNVPLYMAFIDYKKAFDSVRHSMLWSVLRRMGVNGTVVSLLERLYSGQEATVRIEGELSEWFSIQKGVRQGCPVSPVSFNFYSEEVMRQSADELGWIGVNISGRRLNNLRFADDIVLIATSPEALQRLLDEVDRISTEFQLEISTKKTKVMAATKENETLNITCHGTVLEQVDKFKYLGSIIDKSATCSTEIRARLGAARSALRSLTTIWKDRTLSKQIKIKLLKTLVWPVALYGCESWTLKASDIDKLKAFEMTCYRRMLRISWKDHRTNESLLEEIGTDREIVACVKKQKLQYFGHMIRAQNLCTHIFEGRLHGTRSRGRPRRRWGDDITDWINKTLAECTQSARDRKRWCELVCRSVVSDLQK